MALSAGRTLRPERVDVLIRRGPGFVDRTSLGYIVIHARRTPAALRQFVMEAFQLVKVAEQDGHELYIPTTAARVSRD